MSGTTEEVRFGDPLDALRAADHRPLSERWSERSREWFAQIEWNRWIRRGTVIAGATVVVIAVAWRLFVASQPPIEDSLPMVQRNAPSAVSPVSTTAPAAPRAVAGLIGEGNPAPPPSTMLVHVAGAVLRPGLITGAKGWRVHDAVEAAGGALALADLNRINLAAPISDGQRIFVPVVGEAVPSVASASTNSSTPVEGPVVIDLNTADAAALQVLPGVGPATAAAISAHRDEHGPFATVDAVVAVRGIGPATLEGFREHVTVG